MLDVPGWARQPARRAVSARERPGTVPPFVEPGPGPARAQGLRGAGREPGVRPPAAAPCARGATRMRAGRLEKAMYCREPALGGGFDAERLRESNGWGCTGAGPGGVSADSHGQG
jgi:hypothetical protein